MRDAGRLGRFAIMIAAIVVDAPWWIFVSAVAVEVTATVADLWRREK